MADDSTDDAFASDLTFQLRPYQIEAVEAVLAELGRVRSTLIVMATGLGKTITFAAVARTFARRGRILVLAHREELLQQARDKIERCTGLQCAMERAGDRASSGGGGSPVVVASIQTLARRARRERFAPDEFALLIIDEAHHAAAQSYQRTLQYFSSAKVLGATATPDRGDGSRLQETFETVAYQLDIRTAVQRRYLAPIRQRRVFVEGFDVSSVRCRAGDLDAEQLARLMDSDAVLHEVASPLVELAYKRPTVVFVPSVARAHDLAEVLRGYGATAEAVDGSTPGDERARAVARFTSGEVQYLVNCALFTEGFDAPATSCIAVARPTRSRPLYTQMIGRGTRLHPGKRDLLVLDFCGNAGKHSLISAIDVLGGRELRAGVARKAEELARSREEDVLALIAAADAAVREEEREPEARQCVQVRASYDVSDVDPFEVFDAPAPAQRGLAPPATPRQIELLQRFGVPITKQMDSRSASQLIELAISRRRAGFCSFRQARFLVSRGFRADLSFRQASSIIDAIKQNGWRVPPHLRTDPRFTKCAQEVA